MITPIKLLTNLFIFFLLFLLSSCARTVSQDNDQLYIEIKLKLNAYVDTQNYNYYVLFSKSQTPLIEPQYIQPLNEYFISPGLYYSDLGLASNPNADGQVSYYYSTYFSTWSDYIIIQNNQAILVQSGANTFSPTTTNNADYTASLNFDHTLSIITNTITLTFSVDQLNVSENDVLYCRFLTSKRTNQYGSPDQAGLIQDTISEQISVLLQSQEEEKNLNESVISSDFGGSIDAKSDIISWEISIF